jgi:hypothetical protein
VNVTDVPATWGDAGVALVIAIELPVVPVVTTKAKGELVEDAYVALPEYTASRSTVPIGIDVFAEHTAVVPETETAEHPVIVV